MDGQEQAYHLINGDSLVEPDEEFWHQHVVDAFAAQRATERTKRITLAFALIGLYLYLERGFTGWQVQRAHGDLARRKGEWPRFELPRERGAVTAAEVAKMPAGVERGRAIRAWCEAVWGAYAGSHGAVRALAGEYGIEER
jgi:hypothetical protein